MTLKIPNGPRATFHRLENHRLCLDAARSLGCQVVNISGEDLMNSSGKEYLVFGLLWQIIRVGLLRNVNFRDHPELMRLLQNGEDMRNMPAEAILMRWMNWHLRNTNMKVENFSTDLVDGSAYLHLLHALNPDHVTGEQLQLCKAMPLKPRIQAVLVHAKRLDAKCGTFLTAEDVIAGCEKLNLCFIASLFSKCSGMAPLHEELEQTNTKLQQDNHTLSLKNVDLSDLVRTLHGRIEVLEQENSTLKTQLDRERDELVIVCHAKTEAVQHFATESNDWKSKATLLQQEINTLAVAMSDQNQQLAKSMHDLSMERRHAETFGICADTLTEELDGFRNRQEKLEFLIEHLKIERVRGDVHIRLLRALYCSFPTTESLCRAIYCNEDSTFSSTKLNFERIIDGASKSGYLTKKARDSNSWRIRYVVVRDNFLFYFKNDTDKRAEPKGVIRLDDAVSKYTDNPTKTDLPGHPSYLCITLTDHGHSKDMHAGKQMSFYLAGAREDLEFWRTSISKAEAWWTRKSSVQSMKDELRRRNDSFTNGSSRRMSLSRHVSVVR